MNSPVSCDKIADLWDAWCGETTWSRKLRKFGVLGGQVIYWCGVPRSHSAIPLTFELIAPDGRRLPGTSRLKDIKAAIAQITPPQ